MKRKMSIQRKLTLFTMAAFLLPLCAWMLFAFNIMNERLCDARIASAQNTLEHIGAQMQGVMESCSIYASQLGSNRDALRLVSSPNTDSDIVETYNLKLVPLLNTMKAQNTAIRTVHLIHDNDFLFNLYDLFYRVADLNAYIEEMYRDNSGRQMNVRYYREAPVYAFFEESQAETDCWYVRSVMRTASGYHPYGVVEIVVNNAGLYAMMDGFTRAKGEALCLAAADGTWIHGDLLPDLPYEADLLSAGGVFQTAGKGLIAAAFPLQSMDAMLIYTIDRNAIVMTGTEIKMLLVLLVCSLLSMLFLTRLVSHVIFQRLTKLSDQMDSISVSYRHASAAAESQDEIDRLNEHFSQMLKRMETVNETEKQLIFNDLTNDLKPHFICNAMDMLRLQAERANQTQLAGSVKQISQYFRYSMLRDKSGVTLLSELDDVNNYLELINFMRENKVYLDVSLDEWTERNAEKLTVPKMILQPLVDNAVRHGIQGAGMGLICIRIRRAAENLVLEVEDNGAGMTKEQEAQLRTALAGAPKWQDERRRVGLTNVLMRMDIFFSGQYTFDFVTVPGTGTTFTLTIVGVVK